MRSPEFFFRGEAVSELSDPQRRFPLEASDLALLNPNTGTCPIFRTRRDAEITRAIYRRVPLLFAENKGEDGDPWGVEFRQGLFNMTSDSALFCTAQQLEAAGWALHGNVFQRGSERFLPLYEAKMVHHFDHRFGDYASKSEEHRTETTRALPDVSDSQLANPAYVPLPRYWVPDGEVQNRLRGRWSRDWLFGWRNICSGLDERTVIATVLPRVGVGHSMPLLFARFEPPHLAACMVANLSAMVLDYAARQKLGGVNLTYGYLMQLPVPSPATYEAPAAWGTGESIAEWIRPRVLELSYTCADIQPFARDLGYGGPPFRWDAERRFQIRCELDAAFFHLYGVSDEDVAYILDTFSIVRANEEKRLGSYRTKATVLKLHRAFQASRATGPAVPAESTSPAGL